MPIGTRGRSKRSQSITIIKNCVAPEIRILKKCKCIKVKVKSKTSSRTFVLTYVMTKSHDFSVKSTYPTHQRKGATVAVQPMPHTELDPDCRSTRRIGMSRTGLRHKVLLYADTQQ